MSTASAVFDPGDSSLSSSSIHHAPRDHFTLSTSPGNQDDQCATPALFTPATRHSSTVATPTAVLGLRSAPMSFIPPSTTVTTTMKRAPSRTSSLFQWLPPPCQTSCFFVVGPMLVFPGFSIVLPTPLLAKQLPYVYECSCSNISTNLSDNADTCRPSSPLYASSIANHHDLPDNALSRHFNGTMFGQDFYLTQVAQPLVAHALSTADTMPPALHCPHDPFMPTDINLLPVTETVLFAKPDRSSTLTILPHNNLTTTQPIMADLPHVSAIPDPTKPQQQVATLTPAQYPTLSALYSLTFSSPIPTFLMFPRFDFQTMSTITISKRPPPKPPHSLSTGLHRQIFPPCV
jgi:hypothetical protein